MRRIVTIALMILALGLMACDQPTVDGSSQEAFEASIQEMGEDLSNEEKMELSTAMLTILNQEMDGLMAGERSDPLMRFDGMTADEVIEAADAIED